MGSAALRVSGELAGRLMEPELSGEDGGASLVGGCEVGGWDVGGFDVGGLDVGGLDVGGFDVGGLDVGGLDVGLSLGSSLGPSEGPPLVLGASDGSPLVLGAGSSAVPGTPSSPVPPGRLVESCRGLSAVRPSSPGSSVADCSVVTRSPGPSPPDVAPSVTTPPDNTQTRPPKRARRSCG
ncbi:hypothetical protein RMO59_32460, partial [Streptomyces alfalfae]